MLIAKLWCKQIIMGRRTFGEVPAMLREEVRALLTSEGRADLIAE